MRNQNLAQCVLLSKDSHSNGSLVTQKSLNSTGSVYPLGSGVLDPLAFNEEPPIFTSSSATGSVLLAEPVLFVQGFSSHEQLEHPATLLRGSLVLKVTKPTKIKTITLSFRGYSRTEWPEGIPPRRQDFAEVNQIHSQNWDFFDYHSPMAERSSGAHVIRVPKISGSSAGTSATSSHGENGHNSTPPNSASFHIHLPNPTRHHRSNSNLSPGKSLALIGTEDDESSRLSYEDTHSLKGLANRLRRAASPNPLFRARSRSPSTTSQLASFTSNTKKISTVSASSESHAAGALLGHSHLSPSSSFSISPASSFNLITDEAHNDNNYEFLKTEPFERDVPRQGFRTFMPGEYIYHFESPISPESPESVEGVFGSVRYYLESTVERPGVLKSNLSGRREVKIVRTPCDESLEFSEPICISKDWEDQLHYDIIILGKAFPLETSIPIAFKLTPLAKVKCHRIRVYMTEHGEYWCRKKKVHRIVPPKKFLLYEKKADKISDDGSLLCNLDGLEELYENGSTEFEISVPIPGELNKKDKGILRSNYNTENIKINHWIKIVLRLSRRDPNNPEKSKHFEISIDSPFHLLDSHCKAANIMLPEYLGNTPSSKLNIPTSSQSSLPKATTSSGTVMPPGTATALLSQPSAAPPPLYADVKPASVSLSSDDYFHLPPEYESVVRSGTQSYVERFKIYQQQLSPEDNSNITDNGTDSTSTMFNPDSRTNLSRTITATNEVTINSDSEAEEDEIEPLPRLSHSITREVMLESGTDSDTDFNMDSEEEENISKKKNNQDNSEVSPARVDGPSVTSQLPPPSSDIDISTSVHSLSSTSINNSIDNPLLHSMSLAPSHSHQISEISATTASSTDAASDNFETSNYIFNGSSERNLSMVSTSTESSNKEPLSRGRARVGRKSSSHSVNLGPLICKPGSNSGTTSQRSNSMNIGNSTSTRGRNNSSSSLSSITASNYIISSSSSQAAMDTVTNEYIKNSSPTRINTSGTSSATKTTTEINSSSTMNSTLPKNQTNNNQINNTAPHNLSLSALPQIPSWVNWNTHPIPTPSPGARMHLGRHGSIVSFETSKTKNESLSTSVPTAAVSTTAASASTSTQGAARIDGADDYFSHETSFQFSEGYANRLQPILSTTSSVDYCEMGPRGYPRRMDSIGASEMPLLMRSGSLLSITSMPVQSDSDHDDNSNYYHGKGKLAIENDESDDDESLIMKSINNKIASGLNSSHLNSSLATHTEESALPTELDELSVSPGESSNGLVRVSHA
ncbi:hypothetical protein NADFUDRAFT_81732 [Nadsonia fulvescens var. elongata DSM 6958]|uniref:Arrestin C-terminal-like domain-containing protein n=1 Tax=Nadsonia fulvescens var. elongata DSM 6958 TaxID=857566 RepID=A0A1E3PPJ6_9ASCO|nr:hypothetical protein NADFUDRAFT_81732 [Nadsonia fulvescens var. elongata DSM 6958]